MSLVRKELDHAIFTDAQGLERRIKLYDLAQVELLERAALRSHAMYLYQTLGPNRIGESMPDSRDDLVDFIVRVQRAHLGHGSVNTTPTRMLSPSRRDGTSIATSLSPMRNAQLAELAAEEAIIDNRQGMGYGRHQTLKFVLEESHSKHAEMLARAHPLMAAAILREINDGIQRFHDGLYGGDLWLSQRKLAEDVYKELVKPKPGSLFDYKDKFLNFSVVVGNIGYAGNVPCFRYKVCYPERFTNIFDTAWISVFFTLRETELRTMLGSSDPFAEGFLERSSSLSDSALLREREMLAERAERASFVRNGRDFIRDVDRADLARLEARNGRDSIRDIERADMARSLTGGYSPTPLALSDTPLLSTLLPPSSTAIYNAEIEAAADVIQHQSRNSYLGLTGPAPARPDLAALADAEMAIDSPLAARRSCSQFILEESHSKHAELLARSNPLMAAAILREIHEGIQKFHDGIFGGDLYLAEKALAECVDQELNRDKDGSFFRYRDKFLNFVTIIGNMGYCGDVPCFRYKIRYPERWTTLYDSAYVSVFFTLREVELQRLLGCSRNDATGMATTWGQ